MWLAHGDWSGGTAKIALAALSFQAPEKFGLLPRPGADETETKATRSTRMQPESNSKVPSVSPVVHLNRALYCARGPWTSMVHHVSMWILAICNDKSSGCRMVNGGEDRQMFAELQARFLREGEQICNDLLSRPPEALEPADVKRRAHEWAGIGGMLGFPEIPLRLAGWSRSWPSPPATGSRKSVLC